MRRMGAKELRASCSAFPNNWVKTSTRKRACHPCKAINYKHIGRTPLWGALKNPHTFMPLPYAGAPAQDMVAVEGVGLPMGEAARPAGALRNLNHRGGTHAVL